MDLLAEDIPKGPGAEAGWGKYLCQRISVNSSERRIVVLIVVFVYLWPGCDLWDEHMFMFCICWERWYV